MNGDVKKKRFVLDPSFLEDSCASLSLPNTALALPRMVGLDEGRLRLSILAAIFGGI